jgi:hypothetical protein
VYDDVKFAPPQEILCWGANHYKSPITDSRSEEFHTGYNAYFLQGVLPDGVNEEGFIIEIVNSYLKFTNLDTDDAELLARLLVCQSGNKLSLQDYHKLLYLPFINNSNFLWLSHYRSRRQLYRDTVQMMMVGVPCCFDITCADESIHLSETDKLKLC